jgi:hypothetical protein
MKPIILQVPNRDANSAKLIRPVQGTFSGLQQPPDSDRFTLLIRRFRVRIPGGAPYPPGLSYSRPTISFVPGTMRERSPGVWQLRAYCAGPSATIAQCKESWTQAQTVAAGTAGDCKWAGIVEL